MAISDTKLKEHKISEDDLASDDFFRVGVHKVIITKAVFDETSEGLIFVNIELKGQNGETGEAKLFFTEKSTKISIGTIRRILVHSLESEDDKAKVRALFDKITSLYSLKSLLPKLVGKEAWYKVEKSDKTYTDKETGEIKTSYNRNLYGYEPKEKSDKAEVVESATTESKPIETAEQMINESEAIDDQIDLSDIPF